MSQTGQTVSSEAAPFTRGALSTPSSARIKFGDSHSRSVVKAISWRATGTLDTMVVSFLVTRRLKLALSIGFVELFTKIALYYLHERVWDKIRFGRTKAVDDYEI